MTDPSAMRVLVGFSGGVDSAMTALLLRDRGYAVTAAMMSVRDDSGHGCGVTEDVSAARELASRLDIPLAVIDCGPPYRELVLGYFRREYLAGRTPNPCIRCNPLLKFGLFPELARKSGIDFSHFATGHYARIEYDPRHGRHILLRGVDHGKDQSYFLYRLNRDRLSRILFPLGGMRKTEVRALARERGLPVHDKPDSQDFYAGDYADLLGVKEAPGDIVDLRGKVLGRHNGYWNFTPGQRKGLGVAFTEPLYVLDIVPEENRVVVGTRTEQLSTGCVVDDLHFILPPPNAGERVTGRLRSSQPLRRMIVGENTTGGGLHIHFVEPIHGVAPGQSLVLYDDEAVLGGGVIRERV